MATTPQEQDVLMKFTLAAKKVIFDPERMKGFLQMLGSQEGALQAVHTVIAIIGQQREIPTNIIPLLGVNVYMVMVDLAQDITHRKADPKILSAVIKSILSSAQAAHAPQQVAQAQPAPQQPPGIIGQQMGVAA